MLMAITERIDNMTKKASLETLLCQSKDFTRFAVQWEERSALETLHHPCTSHRLLRAVLAISSQAQTWGH